MPASNGAEPSGSSFNSRQLTDTTWWFAGCLRQSAGETEVHAHLSSYLVLGSERAAMIDTGHPKDWRAIRTKLEALLNGRTLDFIIPTHPEYPHAGNIGSLAAQYPESTVVGDVRDYHLYYPDLASRLVSVDSGQPLDLGSDAILSIVPGVIRDLSNTIWVHDSVGRVLYVSDGFGYSHRHGSGECVCLSSEMYSAPGRGEAVFVLERAMPWSRLVRNAEAVQAVHDLMLRHPADTVAPAHGNVIDNPVDLLPTLSAAMVEFGVR